MISWIGHLRTRIHSSAHATIKSVTVEYKECTSFVPVSTTRSTVSQISVQRPYTVTRMSGYGCYSTATPRTEWHPSYDVRSRTIVGSDSTLTYDRCINVSVSTTAGEVNIEISSGRVKIEEVRSIAERLFPPGKTIAVHRWFSLYNSIDSSDFFSELNGATITAVTRAIDWSIVAGLFSLVGYLAVSSYRMNCWPKRSS